MRNIEKYLPVILALLIPALGLINQTHIEGPLPWSSVISQYLVGTFFLVFLWYGNVMGERLKSIPLFARLSQTALWAVINSGSIIIFLSVNVMLQPIIWKNLPQIPLGLVVLRMIVASVVFTFIQQALNAIKQREALRVQNLSLQAENLTSQLEAMKQQINPHFLFNSLNSLLDLIEEDQEKATEFVRSFSNLYRVVLQSSQRDFISLEDELIFLEDYWHLIKMRFNSAVDMVVSIPEEIKNYWIPPLSLQLLVENAVKHNIATPKEQLVVTIEARDDELVISNKVNPKAFEVAGEGVGLKNLQKRFSLLLKPISFGVEADLFVIKLPLKPV
ncbi:MAG: histidine kinase [Cytophagales bacterium]|nr:histidine kinase [Cytophagales bacterium]